MIRYGIYRMGRALPDAVHTVREWYRDDRIGRRVDSALIITGLVGFVAGCAYGLVRAYMWLAA